MLVVVIVDGIVMPPEYVYGVQLHCFRASFFSE